MREIKIRAWDTVNKMWLKITGFETHILDDDKTASINTGIAGMFHDGDYIGTFQQHGGEQNNVILVEYTGLKDKNGVEIYEGDIVAYLDSYDTSTESGYDFEEFINKGEIVFNEKYGRFDVTNRSDIDYFDFIECVGEYEVVGNIYENPSLIK